MTHAHLLFRGRFAYEIGSDVDNGKISATVEMPSRKAANRLYRQIGLVQRETNVYRYTLEP